MDFQTFLKPPKTNCLDLYQIVYWSAKLTYLADIFAIWNELNTSMQGRMTTCFSTTDKIDGQERKLVAWKTCVSKVNLVSNRNWCWWRTWYVISTKCHWWRLTEFDRAVRVLLPAEDYSRKKTGLIRNTFIALKYNLTVVMEDILSELSADELKVHYFRNLHITYLILDQSKDQIFWTCRHWSQHTSSIFLDSSLWDWIFYHECHKNLVHEMYEHLFSNAIHRARPLLT